LFVVEEFSVDESYFDEIRDDIERDPRNIFGASLVWQTERAGDAGWDDDNPEEPPLQDFEWQSCFAMSHNGHRRHRFA